MGRKSGPWAIDKMKQPTTEIGAYIRKRRVELGLTSEQVKSEKKGLSLISIELGTRIPTDASLKFLAEQLQCTAEELIAIRDKNKIEKPLTFGSFIKKQRMELGLTGLDLVRLFKCNVNSIHEAERDKNGLHKISSIDLAAALQCSVEQIDQLRPPKPERKSREVEILRESPLGKFIFDKRTELHITLDQLGKMIGVTGARIHQIEIGKVSTIGTQERLERLATALEVEPTELEKFDTRIKKFVPKKPITPPADSDNPFPNFGAAVRAHRITMGMTRRQFAEQTGLSYGAIRSYETENVCPKKSAIRLLELVLGPLPVSLLTDAKNAEPPKTRSKKSSPEKTFVLVDLDGDSVDSYVAQGWRLALISPHGSHISVPVQIKSR